MALLSSEHYFMPFLPRTRTQKKSKRYFSRLMLLQFAKISDVMRNEYFMSYETYKIVLSPLDLPSLPFISHTSLFDVCFN